jgi:hypothetical protein
MNDQRLKRKKAESRARAFVKKDKGKRIRDKWEPVVRDPLRLAFGNCHLQINCGTILAIWPGSDKQILQVF